MGVLFAYPVIGGQRRRSPPQGADKEDGMDRWVSFLKMFGVSVLLAMSLLSSGNPAVPFTDSAPSLMIRPSRLSLNIDSSVGHILGRKTPAAESNVALLHYSIGTAEIKFQELGRQTVLIQGSSPTGIVELLADSHTPDRRMALFEMQRLSQPEDSTHE
jgi:hypothetical protein